MLNYQFCRASMHRDRCAPRSSHNLNNGSEPRIIFRYMFAYLFVRTCAWEQYDTHNRVHVTAKVGRNTASAFDSETTENRKLLTDSDNGRAAAFQVATVPHGLPSLSNSWHKQEVSVFSVHRASDPWSPQREIGIWVISQRCRWRCR